MALENTQAQYFIRKSYKKVWNKKLRSLVRMKKKKNPTLNLLRFMQPSGVEHICVILYLLHFL